ncbi:MAG: hypothetical protein QOD39_575 [Mycobacterium sp.]|nr:hypothetical protein [Mycobacterium sp.]
MTANRHEAPERPDTLRDRFRDAIAPRTLLLGLGVLLLQFGFIVSYIGAFHSPSPHQIPVTVVAPEQVAGQIVDQLDAVSGQPVVARALTHEIEAREALRAGETSGVYVFRPEKGDLVLVASGGGTAVASAVEQIFTIAAKQHGRTVTVQDLVPLDPGDARGLSGFYLVIGWAVGGYLFAAMLGVAKGSRPATLPRAVWRLGATVPYALASGLGGAVIAEPLLHALNGHFWSIAGIGVLVTLSAATVTIALQTLFGVIGIGLTVVIFVILGNPSAGGAYQAPLLPPFWRAIGSYLPNGAATDAIRKIVYFDGHGITHPIVVLLAWVIGGAVLTLAASAIIKRARQ